MTLVPEIKSAYWQIATTGFGEIVEGTADINQCIAIAIMTIKGSDPFRYDFGSDIWDWVDRPLGVAAPNMVSAITDAINTWEKRVRLTTVTYSYQDQDGGTSGLLCGIKFNVAWELVGGGDVGELELLYNPASAAGVSPFQIAILATENRDALVTENGEVIQL